MRIKKTLETFINMLGYLQEIYLFFFVKQFCKFACEHH